eukprot:g17199.t1
MALASAPLKRFYKYLLKRVIGSFLKRDIDLDQLEVQLWSGQVQLKGLELDVSSLNALGLSCTAANLGCVKMVVPWRRLVSDHCKAPAVFGPCRWSQFWVTREEAQLG